MTSTAKYKIMNNNFCCFFLVLVRFEGGTIASFVWPPPHRALGSTSISKLLGIF